MNELPAIPLTDIREHGPVRHAMQSHARARALRDECLAWLPKPVHLLVPAMDAVTRRWLERSCSPYIGEVEAISAALGFAGIWFLNGTYQWGCTAVARDEEDSPWLARTLDWPFHGLGRHIEMARMQGPAGEFFNVGWPGYAGVLTAAAPGRFAAAINQAPLWRCTSMRWLRPYDIAANALRTWRIRYSPPDHLLRQVFETCRNFADARDRLQTAPLARPVIFTLAGCKAGEHCIIERTEQSFVTYSGDTAAANDWIDSRMPWEARVCSKLLFTCSYEEAARRSRARREALSCGSQSFARASFDWLTPPVLNAFTRVAVEMCPAHGILRAVGYELALGGELARPVTRVTTLADDTAPASSNAQQGATTLR
jgi:hypothetical protein